MHSEAVAGLEVVGKQITAEQIEQEEEHHDEPVQGLEVVGKQIEVEDI